HIARGGKIVNLVATMGIFDLVIPGIDRYNQAGMFSLESITNNVQNWLNANFSTMCPLIIHCAIVILLAMGLFATLGLVLVLMERKVAAHMQIRLGPNRVGPKGMFQTAADTLKLIMKEGLTPEGADKLLFNLAPFVVMIVSMLLLA